MQTISQRVSRRVCVRQQKSLRVGQCTGRRQEHWRTSPAVLIPLRNESEDGGAGNLGHLRVINSLKPTAESNPAFYKDRSSNDRVQWIEVRACLSGSHPAQHVNSPRVCFPSRELVRQNLFEEMREKIFVVVDVRLD